MEPPNKLLPFAVLLLVPVAWGTYGVAIKQLFALEVPPPVHDPSDHMTGHNCTGRGAYS